MENLKRKLKEIKINVTLSAVISIIVGILLIVYPAQSIALLARVIAVIIMVAGLAIIISQVVEFGANVLGMIVGGVITVIGIWIFAKPAAVMSIIPIAIGVLLVVHGVQDMMMAVEGARAHAQRAWTPFVIAGINILLGLLCILDAFGIVKLTFMLIGVMMIFDGLTDLGIVHKVRKASKDVVDGVIIDEEDI